VFVTWYRLIVQLQCTTICRTIQEKYASARLVRVILLTGTAESLDCPILRQLAGTRRAAIFPP
jgi:hypothetical protein